MILFLLFAIVAGSSSEDHLSDQHAEVKQGASGEAVASPKAREHSHPHISKHSAISIDKPQKLIDEKNPKLDPLPDRTQIIDRSKFKHKRLLRSIFFSNKLSAGKISDPQNFRHVNSLLTDAPSQNSESIERRLFLLKYPGAEKSRKYTTRFEMPTKVIANQQF